MSEGPASVPTVRPVVPELPTIRASGAVAASTGGESAASSRSARGPARRPPASVSATSLSARSARGASRSAASTSRKPKRPVGGRSGKRRAASGRAPVPPGGSLSAASVLSGGGGRRDRSSILPERMPLSTSHASLRKPAGRNRRREDVSYLHDRPGHGISPRGYSDFKVPPSTVPAFLRIIERSPLPPKQAGAYETWYDEREAMWHTVVFPALKPASRQDVALLERWLGEQMGKITEQFGERITSDNMADVVQAAVPVLSMSLNELVRQVALHCSERGQLLDKTWKSFTQLFDAVLVEMKDTMDQYQTKMMDLMRENAQYRAELDKVHARHDEELAKVASDTERRWAGRLKPLQAAVREKDEEIRRLQGLDMEFKRWLPRWSIYRDSVLRSLLPAGDSLPATLIADDALLADAQRLLGLLTGSELVEEKLGDVVSAADGMARSSTVDSRVREELLQQREEARRQAARAADALEEGLVAADEKVAAYQKRTVELQEEVDALKSRISRLQKGLGIQVRKLMKQNPIELNAMLSKEDYGDDAAAPASSAMPLIQLQRILHRLVADMLSDAGDAPLVQRQSTTEFVYDWYLNKYGLKQIADRHLRTLLTALKAHDSELQVQHFKRLLGVDGKRMAEDEESVYLTIVLRLLKFYPNPKDSSSSSIAMVPASVAVDALHEALTNEMEPLLLPETVVLLVKEVDAHAKRNPRAPAIELFDLLNRALRAWRDENEDVMHKFEALYKAGDINEDGELSFDEFSVIVRCADPDLSDRQVLFMFRVALLEAGEEKVRPASFATLSRQAGLRFSNLTLPMKESTLMGHIQRRWTDVETTIMDYIKKLDSSDAMIAQLEQRVVHLNRLLVRRMPVHVCWYAMKMLEMEFERVQRGMRPYLEKMKRAVATWQKISANKAFNAWRLYVEEKKDRRRRWPGPIGVTRGGSARLSTSAGEL
eukprot:PLAT8346.1.p1 GENE.PLAT8346.1~~PLAT8346.1.p1  ORF type:complete len:966 (+),score=525.09 PLAT8346.1:64-2898(+)